MKKILVPTDFSSVADNATHYAIKIAAKFKSKLYLYHVYHIHRVDYNLNLPEEEQPVRKRIESKMKMTKLRFEDEINQQGLDLHTVIDSDDIYSLFKRKTLSLGIDLIIMGSKGASGISKVVFGSVAAAVMEITKVPVLIVPPEHAYRPIKKIILAVDHESVDPRLLINLQLLSSEFESEVTVLNVNTNKEEELPRLSDFGLEGSSNKLREIPLHKNINESINEFIEQEGCDLLCMINRKKGFFESIFKKSVTKAQVYNSQIPLLILPE